MTFVTITSRRLIKASMLGFVPWLYQHTHGVVSHQFCFFWQPSASSSRSPLHHQCPQPQKEDTGGTTGMRSPVNPHQLKIYKSNNTTVPMWAAGPVLKEHSTINFWGKTISITTSLGWILECFGNTLTEAQTDNQSAWRWHLDHNIKKVDEAQYAGTCSSTNSKSRNVCLCHSSPVEDLQVQ